MATNRPVYGRGTPRPQSLALIALFLGGVLIPVLVLLLILLSRPGIFALPRAAEIAILVINSLQLAMQIIQFIFIVHQIFVWRSNSPP